MACFQAKSRQLFIQNLTIIKKMFTTTPHLTVLLLYFKPIKTTYIRIHVKTMLGVPFIKRDGIGSTMTLMRLMRFSLILFGSIIYVNISMFIIFVDTMAHQ
jgi:hypothetical protein